MTCRKTHNQAGFTLIEIIVTVVIVAILSAMILTFLSDSLVKSSDPVKRFQKTTDLHRIMANIMADYNKYPKWRSTTVYAENSYVVPTIRNGHYYKCTTSGGCASDVIEPPNWPTSSNATVNDGATVIWTESGLLPLISAFQQSIGSVNSHQNNTYGIYYVDYNNFVQFPVLSDTETPGGSKILKVTIKNDPCDPQTCAVLTSLFVSN